MSRNTKPTEQQLRATRILNNLGWKWTMSCCEFDKMRLFNRIEFDGNNYYQILVAEIRPNGLVQMGPDTIV